MKKNELTDGMILETRDGKRYLSTNGVILDFEGYIKLENYSEDLKNKHFITYDIVKVYKGNNLHSLTSIFQDKYLTLIWECDEIKLTDREIEILKALKTLGYVWLARDRKGELYAFFNEPTKDYSVWDDDSKEERYYFPIKEKDLFNFIKWEDVEPTSIDDLLKGE